MDSTPPIEAAASPADSGLLCPVCEYNLTGIASERCPECGTAIDWDKVRLQRQRETERIGPPWERARWLLLPVAFVQTALQAALMPWRLAARIQSRPPLLRPLAFLVICILTGGLIAATVNSAGAAELAMWVIGVLCQVLLQTLLFAWLLPPWRSRHRLRFWFAASAYTSYTLIAEGLASPPYILNELSNLWPLCAIWHSSFSPDADWITNVVYYLWWVGLGIIAWVRLAPRRRRRVVLVVLLIPLMTYASSYTGCYLGGMVA
ncbi:MAG: hypothetical protein JXO22_10040 [Phycisphaerae bacterium]|nr:hypothetical protein [Phycisphaerae bacterium]